MHKELARERWLDHWALADGVLAEADLKGMPFWRTFLSEALSLGELVSVGRTYRATEAFAEVLANRKEDALRRQEAEKQEAARKQAEEERKQAEAERRAAELEAARQHALELAKKAYQAFRAKHEKIVAISGLVKALGISKTTLARGLEVLPISSCTDGRGRTWYDLQEAEAQREALLLFTLVDTKFLAAHLGVVRATVRRRLNKLGIEPWTQGGRYRSSKYLWRDACVLFPPPTPLLETLQSEYSEKIEAAKRAEEERKQALQQKILLKQQQDREKLLAMFPIAAQTSRPDLIFSVGPTNSGKTHSALEALATASSGLYLAPLRLLAWEVYERLNARGIPCDLVTGEEVIRVPHARHRAATVEMFLSREEEVIVLDEAQMAADPERGWAWTRVLSHAQAKTLHLCLAPEALPILRRFTAALGYAKPTILTHQRLGPLELYDGLLPIEKATENCIYIVFSRVDALVLKSYLEEEKGVPTSVLYGALPPDVRRTQAERFLRGETKVCVATDAVGMGINLPARYVAFTTLWKFDGKQRRLLTSAEVRQIAGRAGRFGMHETGWVGACSLDVQKQLVRLFETPVSDLSLVRVAPTLQELELLSGLLQHRLFYWSELRAIPPSFQSLVSPCEVQAQIDLALMLTEKEQQTLGLERCLVFVQAPVSRDVVDYWRRCVSTFLKTDRLPKPPEPQNAKAPSKRLLFLERAVRERELFLWLAHRGFFSHAADPSDVEALTQQKHVMSREMDDLLCRARLKERKQCRECGTVLPPLAWKRVCDVCEEMRGW